MLKSFRVNLLQGLFDCAIVILGVCVGVVWLVFFPIAAGYTFLRILLKVLGLHSASPDQFRGEIKLAKVFAVLLLLTVVYFLLAAFCESDSI